MFRSGLTLVVPLAGILALACSSSGDDGAPSDSIDEFTRTASAGSIEVEATWILSADERDEDLAAYPLDRFLLLEVKLDTHSGDLGSIDMVEASALKTGASSQEPEAWVASSDDAHHRAGVLVFERKPSAGPVTLVIDLDDGAAELAWDRAPG